MHDSETVVYLRFTVSGGLEDFVEKQVEEVLQPKQWRWVQRARAGSQLLVCCAMIESIQEFSSKILSLRLAEYVYMRVYSQNLTSGCLPEHIEEDITSNLDHETLQLSMDVGRECQALLRDRSVGLEKLPGKLLSAPKIDDISDTHGETALGENVLPSTGFVVNTIFTRTGVAKAVAQAFVRLVQENDDSIADILWLDAGAGAGALLNWLPTPRVGIDTHPAGPEIRRMNFFSLHRNKLTDIAPTAKNICIISNPPFSEGSRGDFSAIVKFINHSINLDARFVGLIVPTKFARVRIWKSLGMNCRANLISRFFLPQDSFLNPSTKKTVHIHSCFLFFRIKGRSDPDLGSKDKQEHDVSRSLCMPNTIHVTGKRDKGSFPEMSTAKFTASVVSGLGHLGLPLAAESQAEFSLSATLKVVDEAARLELGLLLNPGRPFSLVNSVCSLVSNHSLGWMSTSAKPALAYTMLSLATESQKPGVVINSMSGEGTFELEAQDANAFGSMFIISGDKNETAVRETAHRLAVLGQSRSLVDLVVWDAQHLPLRTGIADVFLSDLPIAGSSRKKHQEPCTSGSAQASTLDYKFVIAHALRILTPQGRAAVLSSDSKSMSHALSRYQWKTLKTIQGLNVGGLPGQLSLLQKMGPCWKDLSVCVSNDSVDLSDRLLDILQKKCHKFTLNSKLELVQQDALSSTNSNWNLIRRIELVDTFHHAKESQHYHCYRIWFDDQVSNNHAKQLEKHVRAQLSCNLPDGIISMR